MTKINPFITSGYISAKYFCDRITETTTLTRYITNGNNVALISPRRLGKTGLIEHCFHQQQIRKVYFVILQREYTSLKSRELEKLPHFRVTSWQPFQLPWSASLCLFG